MKCALDKELSYVTLPVRTLLEMTIELKLILNPASPYSKEFLPSEIHALLETGMNSPLQSRVIQKETKILIGQPENYPTEMVSALTTLLAKYSEVKAAYLCLMHNPSSGNTPSLVVGLEGKCNLTKVIKAADSVAADTVTKGDFVDFVMLKRDDSGVSSYMLNSAKPFYKCAWRTKLLSFLN